MIGRTVHMALRLIMGLLVVLIVAAILLVWRLQTGPISLSFLNTYVERALNREGARFLVSLDETVLTWGGWERTIDVRVIGARATDSDGRVVLAVPEAAVAFSIQALMRGSLAPKAVEVFRPRLHLLRGADGRFEFGLGDDRLAEGSFLKTVVDLVAAAPSPDNLLGHLDRFGIVDGDLVYEDREFDVSLAVPVRYLDVVRRNGGVAAEGALALPLTADDTADIFVQAVHEDGDSIGVTVQFAELNPSGLGRVIPALADLKAADLSAQGHVTLSLGLDGTLRTASADLSAGAGTVDLAAATLGTLPFESIAARARLDAEGNWRSEAEVVLADGADRGRVTAAADLDTATGRRDLILQLSGVMPAHFAALLSDQPIVSAIRVPFDGTATVSTDAEGALEGIGFDLTGRAGTVAMPVPDSEPVAVDDAVLRGHVEGAFDRVVVEEAAVSLADGGTVPLPLGGRHALPLRTVSASASYAVADDVLTVDSGSADLDGPQAAFSGTVSGLRGEASAAINGSLRDVPVDRLGEYWPAGLGSDARKWVLGHMSAGTLDQVEVAVEARATEDGFRLDSLDGTMAASDTTVAYLGELPPATEVAANARFGRTRFDIEIESGAVGGLTIHSGVATLTEVDTVDPFADIELFVDGPFNDVLSLIDRKPLEFASQLGLSPARTGGWAATRLHLFLPMEKDLSVDDIQVDAQAELRDVLIKDAVLDLDIGSGNLLLRVDKRGMDVNGRIVLGTMSGLLDWRENFTSDSPFRSRYDISTQISERQRTQELGLAFPPFSGDIIRGPTGATVRHTVFRDGRGRMDARIDLSEAEIDLSFLKWEKALGVPGAAEVTLDIVDQRIVAVPRFSVAADDLSIAGAVEFTDRGERLDRITFHDIRYARTDITGLLIQRPQGGWDADFNGTSFDMATLLGENLTDTSESGADYAGPPLSLSANVETVWLAPDRALSSVAGALAFDGARWTDIRLQGRFEEDQEFQVLLGPDGAESRRLSIRSGDAGAAMRGLGLYENMTGGSLEITGTYDDSQADSPLNGRILVNDFRIVRAPLLVQLLSVMALTGVLDVLQGEGLIFNTLDAPFTMVDGVMTLEEGRAAGTSLGFTASGTIDTRADIIDLEGTVVPAYLINSALGRLPLVGGIFSGGEKGSGVFAATYTMRGDTEEPEISVNPLSALAPGFLRGLFGIFDGAGASKDSTGPSAAEESGPSEQKVPAPSGSQPTVN